MPPQLNKMITNVKGPVEGSFMTLFEELQPITRERNIQEQYVRELRGLWNMSGAFMGGPYIAHAFLNKSQKSIIIAFGYVFAPKFDKREYLRELEAISLSSLK